VVRALSCFAAVAVVASAISIVAPRESAQASYASSCGSPTRTLNPGSASVSASAGQTVLLSGGRFTGGIDSLPAGATICVASGSTLAPGYMNNAAGVLAVASGGTLQMPYISVGTGFDLELEGTATFAGLNINGSSRIAIAASGALTISNSFSPSTGDIVNAGTVHVASSVNLNSGVSLTNSGSLTIDQSSTLNGPLINSGTIQVSGSLTVNGSGTLQNDCAMAVSGDLNNNGSSSSNHGIVLVSGGFSNNGGWSQSSSGTLGASTLSDDGRVTGYGNYRFTGTTSVQGTFTGDSAGAPIVVDSAAPAGQIFTVHSGTIRNVARGTVTLGTLATYPAPDCAVSRSSADVVVGMTSPNEVTQGNPVTFTVRVSNLGPNAADAVVARATLPTGLSGAVADSGGTITGQAVQWSLGSLAAGASRTLQLTGTATGAAGSSLVSMASSTSSTPDPNLANNDGSSDDSSAETTVLAVIPVNVAPVASAQTLNTTTGAEIVGTAVGTDADTDQELNFSIASGPAHGDLDLLPGGGFSYRSAVDFAGIDSAQFRVCDNGTPVLCDDAVLTFTVSPVATPGTAQTFEGEAVAIPIVPTNASPGAVLAPALASAPAHGTVSIDSDAGVATYTPAAGYLGSDAFTFRICAPAAPAVCASAVVDVTVLKLNHAPTVADLVIRTTSLTEGTAQLAVADPDGDTVTVFRGELPRSGTALVSSTGLVSYTPRRGDSGRQTFGVFVCDSGDPTLCSSATVTAEVTPVAVEDSATTSVDRAVAIRPEGNDFGFVGSPAIPTGPQHGTTVVSGTSVTYLPAAGYVGSDEFEYQICSDGDADLCSSAAVAITVTAAAITPTAPTNPSDPTPGAPTAVSPTHPSKVLALTGTEIGPSLSLAGACLALGVALVGFVAIVRRRRRSGDQWIS
jgi:uncharacterized repeat protein (TIGR01451 family)